MSETSYQGLTSAEVEQRIQEGKVNQTDNTSTRSYKDIFRSNIFTFFNLMNIILFTLVLLTGSYRNGLFIGTIIFNTCIGIIQEIHAKRIVDRLSILVMDQVEVFRDGATKTIKMNELVVDDLYKLNQGLQIPADSIVMSGSMEVNESILTGESKNLVKKHGDTLLAGSYVTSGEAVGKVVHVGAENFSEMILRDGKKFKPLRSQLQRDTNRLLKLISFILIPIGLFLFITQYSFLELTWQNAILKTVSALVGMIPEGLIVLISIALAVSTVRLSRKNVLVQDLFSVESLARVDVLCIDKTGTLTKGTMQVQEVVPLEDTNMNHIQEIMGSYIRVFSKGNATDQSLQEYFKENNTHHETSVLPFSSERKYAGVSFEGEGSFYLGAYSFLFPNGSPEILKQIDTYAKKGWRVVVLAHTLEEEVHPHGIPADLEPLCLIAIKDVLRDHVEDIIQYFKDEGVAVKVISGDDPKTVSAIANEAGIDGAEHYYDMSNNRLKDLSMILEKNAVFGRVLPNQKKSMVQSLQRMGHTVAMVGDGVNDVPALKTANVSVAMAAGASATKNCANLVLLTNDFGDMPQIVHEGRRVINNISRASSMYLVKTIFSIILSLYTIFLREEYPFLPIHLTLLSTFGVAIPTFILQMEPSFERVKGRFYARALRNALPSAITVFICAFLCNVIQVRFNLPETRMNTLMLILTGYTYLYTLYKVYFPPDKLRVTVFFLMSLGFVCALIFGKDLLQASFHWYDLAIILPGAILVPIVVVFISRLFDSCTRLLQRAN